MLLVSINWLRELVDVTLTPAELAKTLTIAGFEVDSIEDRSTWADGVVVGKVIERQPHPNADKLSVCTVDIGADEPSTIVCGAKNVCADIYVPVATPSTYLPQIDLKIKPAKLRGVKSYGMICSLSELGLTKESEGIHIFAGEDIKPGDDVRPLLGLDDTILEVTSTANRADGLSMVGIAREVAALTGATVRLPDAPQTEITGEKDLSIAVADSNACSAYMGTIIEGVKIAPSPQWLQWRLEAAGVRPINNVVDVTNYILLEWGQPLHGFDFDKLLEVSKGENKSSLEIGVRFAEEKEILTTLDSEKRELKGQNLLITANNVPVALAGVMGGEETEVSDSTTNLLLEGALFDPVAIRRSSRSQTLRTEASARYERGVNQAELELAYCRAISLICELAGGASTVQSISDNRAEIGAGSRTIELRLARLNQILGKVNKDGIPGDITAEDVEKILGALNCQLELSNQEPRTWIVTVPPYRYRDLEREIDLIEEVARLYGYDNFCDTLPAKTEPGYLPIQEQLKRKLCFAFAGAGLTEVVHYSLVKPSEAEIVISNPLLSEYSALRKDLINGLVDACEYNVAQGNGVLNGFEIGRIFWKEGEKFAEKDIIAGIMGGDRTPDGRWTNSGKNPQLTWFEGKGLLASVFNYLGVEVEYQPDSQDERLHPGRTASLWLQGKRLGSFGQLHPQLRNTRNLPDAVYVFHLSLDVLLEAMIGDGEQVTTFAPYSAYPAVERDLAFFAPTEIAVSQLEQSMKKAGGKLLNDVELFDQYRGENVPEGKRSLAFSLAYRASDRTLTEKEIEPVHEKIRTALVEQFEVTLRS